MAKNENPGHGRVGRITNREQVFNPQNQKWVEINTQTKKFTNVKSDGKPFKDVRHYKPKG